MNPLQIIDLTHPIRAGMPVFPGTPPVEILESARLESDGFNELRMVLTTHTGTHLDTPFHLLAKGPGLNELPLSRFVGPAVVIDLRAVPAGGVAGPEYFRGREDRILFADFVLLLTGWSRFWGQPAYFSGNPLLSEEAAHYLSSFPLKGIGMDAASFDPVDSADLPVHHILLGKGILLIENLVNLEQLPETGTTFSCLPLPVEGGDGSPVRAVAMITC